MNRQLLEAPFPAQDVRERRGEDGEIIGYIPVNVVIHRLNCAFDGAWSFEVIEHIGVDDEIQVLGKLTAEGVTKMQFGASRTDETDGPSMTFGDHLKAASSDALRKCASLFGVGLYMWGANGGSDAPQIPQDEPQPAPKPVTEKQLRAIYAIGRDRGLDRQAIEVRCSDSFNVTPKDLTLEEASSFIKELDELQRPSTAA